MRLLSPALAAGSACLLQAAMPCPPPAEACAAAQRQFAAFTTAAPLIAATLADNPLGVLAVLGSRPATGGALIPSLLPYSWHQLYATLRACRASA